MIIMWPLNDAREKRKNGEGEGGRERERAREGNETERERERATYLLHEMAGWGTPDAKQLKDMDPPNS